MDPLEQLAALIHERNAVARRIASLIGRPALIGHLGEFIAAQIFGIDLEASAVSRAIDGHFREGPLAGRSVNIKWYAREEGLLDITPKALPDHYLVLAGPRGAAASSRGETRPWLIESVHLFDAEPLLTGLRSRGLKIGVATSVRRELWRASEVYPHARHPTLIPSAEQRRLLALFGPLEAGAR